MKTISRYCLKCGTMVDGATEIHDSSIVPQPGDATICIYCGFPQIFTEDGFRRPTHEETERLTADPDFMAVLTRVLEMVGEL